jgi:hypothetical protein
MRGLSFALPVLSSSLLIITCAQAPTEPSGLSLQATVSSPSISLGEFGTLTFRLQNLTPRSVSLSFPGGCQVLPFIEDATGSLVYPPGGTWGCTEGITTLTLPPFGGKVITQAILGDTLNNTPEADLPPGNYHAYAILQPNSRQLQLRSAAVAFEVH